MLIPFDRSLGIIAASASFQVTDSVGRRLLASVGNAIPVLVPSGQQPPTVALRVSTKVTP